MCTTHKSKRIHDVTLLRENATLLYTIKIILIVLFCIAQKCIYTIERETTGDSSSLLIHNHTSCYERMNWVRNIFTVVIKKCFRGLPTNKFLEILEVHRREEIAGSSNLSNVMCVWDTICVCPPDEAHQFSRDHSGR